MAAYTADHFPLELFRKELSIHPWHFWQLAGPGAPLTSACNALLYEHAWQDADKVGRDDIRRAIDGAVEKLTEYLGFSPIQHFGEQTLPWPPYADMRVSRYPFLDARRHWTNVQLREGWVQQVGVEALTLIDDTAAVTYSDSDGDGLNDTFTATVATSATDVTQIAVYFSSADRLSDELGDWRVAPLGVTIAGGVATITGAAWLLVVPGLYQVPAPAPLDPSTSTNFVSTVAVYSRSVYTAGQTFADAQATLVYETHPVPWWGWGWATPPTGGSTDPAVNGYAVARAQVKHGELGEVTPAHAVYDPVAQTWDVSILWSYEWEPDRVTVRYLAGYPLTPTAQIDHRMVQLVSRFAAAEMPRPIAACQEAAREIHHWQFDLARSSGSNDESYGLISRADLDNPFGTRRGHVWAWKTIQRMKTVKGMVF